MPFIMTGEGVGRLFSLGLMNEGPFPEHYEPFETPLEANPMHPEEPKAKSNPAARVYKGDMEAFGTAKDFPYVATTYRLTEHFHYWTKQSKINAIMQPEQFVEIGEELAKEKGIAVGDRVKVRLQPRLHQGGGGGNQADQGAGGRWQEGAHHRHPDPLRFQGGDEAGLHHQHLGRRSWAMPIRRRRSTRRSWSTSRRHKGELIWHCNR